LAARIEAASEAQCRAESPDADALLQVVKARAARARSDALKLNQASDFDRAREVIEAEAVLLEELASDLPEAAEEAGRLRADIDHLAAPMPSQLSKSMHYDSYLARRSRGDPHR
jgi:hypothetical protein